MTITPSRINIIAAFAICLMVVPEFAAAASSPQDQKPKVEVENITEVARDFVHPPASARPWVYCCWCNGNVTKDGITADLEAMARVGIGGLLIFDAAVQEPAGKIIYNSPQWHEMIRFTLGEAARLGIKVAIFNAPGWCGSGAPWITPEHSEQQLVWTETPVQGPVHYDAVLARPRTTTHSPECIKAVGDYYKDIALLAYPTLADDEVKMADFSPKVTTSVADPGMDLQLLLSGSGSTKLLLPKPVPGKPQYVQVAFDRPFKARILNLTMGGSPEWSGFVADLQVSDDGSHFRSVRKYNVNLGEQALGFEAVTARYFRVLCTNGDDNMPPKFALSALQLSPRYRIDDLRSKTLVTRGNTGAQATYPALPAGLAIDGTRVIDLTSKFDKDGHLSWDAPAGRWTLLRIGHTSRGAFNHPAPVGGTGLECDKMSKEASDAHFAALIGKLVKEAGPLAGKTLVGMHIDSWEPGVDNLQRTQNWTALFRQEFHARRGYDLLRYLPAMTGRVIDNTETTERFLWDFRQTAGELLAENYAGRLSELARQHGLKLSIEAYGGGPFDDLTYGARADIPMAEYWYPRYDAAGTAVEMSSIAHVYGKPIAAGESFTSLPDERWLGYPGDIKVEGDWALCMGINRIVFHRYAMQPWLNIKPGMSMGSYGLHYERTQTWWEQTRPWHQYLARCQYLLQRGLCSSDICYLEQEGAPRSPSLPNTNSKFPERPGYGYDVAPAEAVLTRFSARDGRMVLPDGMTYRVLVLPNVDTMTVGLLRKIKQLVSDGATVIGSRPLKSPSLSDYPACDAEIKALAEEVWGNCDGQKVKEHIYGKGRIIWGKTADEVLKEMNVPPDFSYDDSHGGPSLRYNHHALGATDYYFVANKLDQAVAGTAHFRIDGRPPEFWWPQTGRTEPVAIYTQRNGVTSIPMQLDSSQSVFVVFPPAPSKADPVVSVALDGQPVIPPGTDNTPVERVAQITLDANGNLRLQAWKPGAYEIKTASGQTRKLSVAAIPDPVEVSGLWQVTFPFQNGNVSLDKLASWSDSNRNDVKYFSGTATYRKTFRLPAEMVGSGRRLYLDLGDVKVNAQVMLNGRKLDLLWKTPYRLEITGAVKPGDNLLEIAVTNLWPNRLIGDAHLPPEKERNMAEGSLRSWPQWLLDGKPDPSGRQSFTSNEIWKKNDALLPSGLLGPVVLRASAEVAVP